MRIVFFCSNQDINVGSYRIWIHDLQKTLSELQVNSLVCHPSDEVTINPKSDVVILSKGDAGIAQVIRNAFPDILIGVINLDASVQNLPINFVIVGSIEEMDSVAAYQNVFLYPLIELMFENNKTKKHKQSNTLKLCFHGHYPHLSKFNPHLLAAIEELKDEIDIELKIITGDTSFKWEIGKPNIPKIKFVKWNYETVADEIKDCDVGIVPNITDYSPQVRSITNKDLGLYETDYCLRFKNKSNAGRCFVFHQLGIPVIADITPSNFHIMGDPKNGYLVLSKDGWKRAFRNLINASHREEIASSARKTFSKMYDPKVWAASLIKNIEEMRNEQRSSVHSFRR